MTEAKKEATTLIPSVGADGGQSLAKETTISLAEKTLDDKYSEEEFRARVQKMEQMHRPNYLHTVTMDELYDMTYQSKPPIVDGFLYSGTYLFVGAPKIGKSFFMAQLAYHVSMGLPLWEMPVQQSDVLYLALEDDYPRLQGRLAKMFDVETTDKLYFATASKQAGNGLEGQIEDFVKQHPETRLVIIDTLQKIRETGGEGYSYGNDYDLVGKLKQFADTHHLCLLLVHHTRKQKSGDSFEMVSGTTGLTGAADGTFVMQKAKRTEATAILEVCGRDQQDKTYNLSRDTQRLFWNLVSVEGETFESPPEPLLDTIRDFMDERTAWSGTATELVALLSVDLKPNKLTMKLNINASRLKNEYNIQYKSKRTFTGRTIALRREHAQHDDNDGHVDKNSTPPLPNLSS